MVKSNQAPSNLAFKQNLMTKCGNTCARHFHLSTWDLCGLSDGQIDGPGHGGMIKDRHQDGFDCWLQCKKESVIYTCTVTSGVETETYTGLTGGQIKKRISAHTTDFKYPENENSTTLSGHIHKLKKEGKAHHLKWSLLDRGPVYNPISKKCRLCLLEKFYIIFKTDTASLNRRSELFNTCRHREQKILGKSRGNKKKS